MDQEGRVRLPTRRLPHAPPQSAGADHVCFHFQQAAEKYVKARLEHANVRFPKTHDIEKLLQIAAPLEPLWVALEPAGKRLSDYAVRIRYPGNEATVTEMKTAHRDARLIRQEVRAALRL